MPGPDWKRFERLVAAIHHAESKGGKVNWNDVIQGRQFDVSVRFKYGLHEYLTVVECKDYASKVPVEKVDALVTKSRDVKANKAILVSANGFQSGCVEVAERYGVKLLTLNEKIDLKVEDLAQEVTPALNIYSVRFVKSGSLEEYEFEDIGGRLAYLMNQAKIELKPKHITPNQLIDEWQLGCPNIYTDRENEIAIPLPSETVIHIPYELPFKLETRTDSRTYCPHLGTALSRYTCTNTRALCACMWIKSPEHSAQLALQPHLPHSPP